MPLNGCWFLSKTSSAPQFAAGRSGDRAGLNPGAGLEIVVPIMTVPDDKAALRAQCLAARRAMPHDQWARDSAAIRRRLLSLPELAGAGPLLSYVSSKDHEVDTHALLQGFLDAQHPVWVPAMRPGRNLAWVPIRSLDDLAPGPFQILEPRPESVPGDPPPDAAPVLVPGIAFTPDCQRIGYGGGYFDRFLARHRGPAIGLAFDLQIIPAFPASPHDIPLALVVTPSRVYRRP